MTPKKLRDDEFGKDLVVSGARKGRHQGGSVRVVKESDSKSDGLCPHRFESCGPRSFGLSSPTGLLFLTLWLRPSKVFAQFLMDIRKKL